MKLTQLFCDADDFCPDFHSSLARKTADERATGSATAHTV